LLSTTSTRSRRGQVLPLFAISLTVLLLVAALAFDVGMALLEQRDEQNAADAAALAGARYVLTSGADAEDAARRIARENGFDDADPDEVVNVYMPPVHGNPIYRREGFIEVEIKANRPSIFAGIIGKSSWDVGVYAIATNRQDLTFPFSMLALDPTACKSIQVSGSGIVEAYGSMQSNSNGSECAGDPVGFSRTGGSTINVYADDATCRSVGLIQDQGSGSMTCTEAGNSFALPDPLRNLPAPARPLLPTPSMEAAFSLGGSPPTTLSVPKNCPGGSPAPSLTSPVVCKLAPTGGYSGTAWTLYPGLYPGGLEVTAGTTAYLMPGVYWIGGGGLRVANGGSVRTIAAGATPDVATPAWGGGVLIYNSRLLDEYGNVVAAGGPIVLDGSGAALQLKALHATEPPDSDYNNIVIFQDRALTTTVTINGSASTTEVEGLIYVPSGQVKLNGNGGTLVVDQIIANTYLIDGGGGNISLLRRTGFDAVIVAAGLVE
jgi:hypothetical protein